MEIATVMEQFHFLRPLWLLSLLPACLLVFYFWRQKSSAANWHGAIDSQLLDHLIEGGSSRTARWPWLVLLACWLIAALALAGPSWKQLPQPIHQKQDALVIVLDLSRSMLAEDIQPSRLVRARHKVLDVLNNRNEGLTALIAYAGDAHIVSPLTDDNPTIANLAPALAPEMMPAAGSDPVAALMLAKQLLINAGMTSGRILLITDGITTADVRAIDDQLLAGGYQLSVLGIGSSDGAPIPSQQGFLKDSQGNIVVPQLKRAPLEQLAELNSGRYTDVTLNDRDIQFLLASTLTDLNDNTVLSDRQFDQWHDRGPLLALLLLPLALLGFRRGWLLMLPLLLLEPQQSIAFEWQDLWQTPDQQAAKAWQQGDSKAAAERFENPQWQGSAHYKAGDYEQAAASFANSESADGHYNRGNALARAGQLQQAIDAYDKALEQQPDMADALANKQLLEQLKQQQEQEQQDSDQQNSEQNSEQQGDQQDQQQDGQPQQGDNQGQQDQQPNDQAEPSEQPSEPTEDPSQQQPEQNSDEQPGQDEAESQQQQPTEESDQSPQSEQQAAASEQASQQQSQEQQAMEQWLRKIPDDPSGLLRRKFNYEYRLRQQQGAPKEESTQW
jgi:Ca-activated chloride channel family protein